MSKSSIFSIIIVSILAFTGCVPPPQNPEELRASVQASGNSNAKKSITVNRSYKSVKKQWQKNANKCLKVRINITGGGYGTTYQDYTPKIIEKPGKTALSVQFNQKDLVVSGGKLPKDGIYFFVADAIPLNNKQTKIDFYLSPSWPTVDSIVKAVKAWSNGRDGCPSLVQ